MRDNSKRVSAAADPAPAAAETDQKALEFSTPTEIVDLPSKGKFYPEGHPLYSKETIKMLFSLHLESTALDRTTRPRLLVRHVLRCQKTRLIYQKCKFMEGPISMIMIFQSQIRVPLLLSFLALALR